MRRVKDTPLPERPDGERWRLGYNREMTPTEANIELIELASEFPSGPEGEAFRRAVVLAVNALKVTNVAMLSAEPDRNIGGRCLIPGAIIASVRAWLPTVAEPDPDAVVKGDALFKPWLEKAWMPTGGRKTRADIFYAAVSIVFPGVEKRCGASGHSLYGLRVKPGVATCEGEHHTAACAADQALVGAFYATFGKGPSSRYDLDVLKAQERIRPRHPGLVERMLAQHFKPEAKYG